MKILFSNAAFHTMEDPHDVRHSLLVEDGVIIDFDVLPSPHTQQQAQAGYTLIDLDGLHVYPALIDAHAHVLETIALSSMGVQLCSITNDRVEPWNLAGIEQRIRAYAADAKPDALMIFSNYISAAMDEKRLPTRHELDAWTNNARVWVLNIDGHSSACSTALLAALELTTLSEDGILTGAAHDAQVGVISDYLASAVTPGMLAAGIADFCNECASYGIGTVCAMEGNDELARDKTTELIAFLARHFPVDIRLFPQYMDRSKLSRVQKHMGAKRVGGCMKWELDGSIGSRTAAFGESYLDGSRGSLYLSSEELTRTIDKLSHEDYFVSAHAIGELAIEQLIEIYERVPGTHRIDHCEFPSPDILERIYKLKPFITIQPGYAWMDKRYLHGYERFLTHDKLMQQIPLKDFAEHGVPLCGSSDAPVQTIDPFLQMRGMREFYVESQSLSAFEALKTYTVNGGEMLGEKKGLLRRGYEASFFTTTQDLLKIEPCGLENMRAQQLYVRGKRYKPLKRNLASLARLLMRPARLI